MESPGSVLHASILQSKKNISCCFVSRISYTVLLFRAVKLLNSITFYTTLLHTSCLFFISNYLKRGAPQSEFQIHNLPYSLWRWVLQISSVKTLNLVDFSMISSFKQLISWWRDAVDPLCRAFRTRIKSDYDRRLPSTLPRIDSTRIRIGSALHFRLLMEIHNIQKREGVWVVSVCVCDDHWLVVDSSSSAGDPFVLEICFLHASCCFCLCLSVCDCGSVLRALSMY